MTNYYAVITRSIANDKEFWIERFGDYGRLLSLKEANWLFDDIDTTEGYERLLCVVDLKHDLSVTIEVLKRK